MKIKTILDEFYTSIANLMLQERTVTQVAQSQRRVIAEYVEIRPDGTREDLAKEHHNMAFKSPLTGDWQFYGKVELTYKDYQASVVRHENRQYQWMLAEAYEELEDFIERIYAGLGFHDRAFWPLEDFGNLRAHELASLTFPQLLALVKKKHKEPVKTLLPLIRRATSLDKLEANNKLRVNFKFTTATIAQLRHHIVHTGGQVGDAEAFQQKILESVGLFRNGKPAPDLVAFLQNYFLFALQPHTICLVNIPAPGGVFYHDTFSESCNLLLSHAFLIASEAEIYLSKRVSSLVKHRLATKRRGKLGTRSKRVAILATSTRRRLAG